MYNRYFNSYWDKNLNNIKKNFDIFFKQLNNIKLNIPLIDKKYKWKEIISTYPIIYEYYNYEQLTYEEFEFKYYTNKYNIKIKDSDLIKFYKLIDDEIILNIYKMINNIYFISLDIISYINNNINTCDIYNIKINISKIKLFILYKTNYSQNILNNIVIIINWIYNIKNIKNNSYTNNLNIYIFDIPIDKKIYTTNFNNIRYLCSKNVNSGVSFSNNIIIYRREELYKVLIHELIHALELYNTNKIDEIIDYKIGIIDYPIIINETITELLAQYLYIIYHSNIVSNIENKFLTFKKLYLLEHKFNWYQFIKIFKFYKIDECNINKIKLKFNQSTNVYSYYILKCYFCLNFDLFISYINDSSINIIDNIYGILNNIPYNYINYLITKTIINNKSLRMTYSHI